MADLPTLADLDGLEVETNGAGPSLASPRFRVTLDDGRILEVQVRNPDMLRWDRTATKHGWPSAEKMPKTWATFCAWAALRREGQIPETMTWEEFSEQRALEVDLIRADAAHPTRPGAAPG